MRIYEITKSGRRVPSATTIVGQMEGKGNILMYWALKVMANEIYENLREFRSFNIKQIMEVVNAAKKAHQKIAKQSMITGTRSHEVIENYILYNKKPDFKRYPDIVNPFKAFLKFKKDYNPDFKAIETSVYLDDRFGYAGTVDAFVEINGKLYALDWKTSNALYDSYRYQLALYRSTDPEGIDGTMAVRLAKDTGEYEVKDYSDTFEEDREIVLQMSKLFHLMNADEIKNSKVYKKI